MNTEIDNALDELLLARPVTEDQIIQAYRRMAKRFHPDKATAQDEKQWVQKKFLRIQEAYECLKALAIDNINTSVSSTDAESRSPRDRNAGTTRTDRSSANRQPDSSATIQTESLQEAVRQHPDNPELRFRLGCEYVSTHRMESAAIAFREAVRLQPDYVDAYMSLGSALAFEGKWKDAREAWQEAERRRVK